MIDKYKDKWSGVSDEPVVFLRKFLLDIFELAVNDSTLTDHILKIRGDVGHLDVNAISGVVSVEEDFCEDVVVAFGCFQLDLWFLIEYIFTVGLNQKFFLSALLFVFGKYHLNLFEIFERFA